MIPATASDLAACCEAMAKRRNPEATLYDAALLAVEWLASMTQKESLRLLASVSAPAVSEEAAGG